MVALELITEIIFLIAFFYGAIKLWKKGKPLYFQIIICAIGCLALFHLSVIVMAYCNVNETYFNDSFFGILGCYTLLFCANRGALEKVDCKKPKAKVLIFSILAGIIALILSTFVGAFYYGVGNFVFYVFVLVQIPACSVVYFNVKHLLSPMDEHGMLKGLRLTDIFSLTFIVTFTLDIACWKSVGILSAIVDLVVSLVITALSVSAVKGAEKWNF